MGSTKGSNFSAAGKPLKAQRAASEKPDDEDEHTKMIKSLPSFKKNPQRGFSQDMKRGNNRTTNISSALSSDEPKVPKRGNSTRRQNMNSATMREGAHVPKIGSQNRLIMRGDG